MPLKPLPFNSRLRLMRLPFAVAMVAVLFMGTPTLGQGVLPNLIKPHLLNQYLKYMTLSDEQLVQIQRLHEAYLKNWSESFDGEIASFNAAWGAVYVSPDRFTEESMEKTFREAREKSDRLASKLRVANDDFFDGIELLLTEEQRGGLQRARLAHDRYSYRRSKNGLRERHIDLVKLLDELNLDDHDRSQSNAFVGDYEPVFVQALRQAGEADQKVAQIEFAALDLIRTSPNQTPDPATQARIDELCDKAGKLGIGASTNLSRQIVADCDR